MWIFFYISYCNLYYWATLDKKGVFGIVKGLNKHKEIQQAISEGEALLLNDLFSALKRKAVGYKEKTTSKAMRKNPIGGTETKVTEDEKYYPPDFEAIKYILVMKFGKDFDPKKYMYEYMDKKNEPEEWANATPIGTDDDKED